MQIRILFLFIVLSSVGCSLFSKESERKPTSTKLTAEQKTPGVKITDEGLAIVMKFNCAPDAGGKPFKIRAFKYKIHVLENDKQLNVEGTQRAWLDTNLTMLKLKYNKNRKIDFKNVEISTDKWIRAFPENQLKEPINFSYNECKDLGSY
jgi:hypothetical protein